MKRHLLSCTTLGLAAVLACATGAFGQGQIMDALSAAKNPEAAKRPTPRTADGHPDLNGVWHHFFLQGTYTPLKPGESVDFTTALGKTFSGGGGRGPAPGGAPPAPPSAPEYKPDYAAKVKELDTNQEKVDTTLQCAAPGVPRLGPPNQIVQTAHAVVFLYTDLTGEFFRVIPTDGSPHRTDIEASANGDSIGHWDGDTLVVDGTNFTDDTWLGDNGLMHSGKLHVIERLTRKGDTINYEVTVDDPVVLVKPWIMSPRLLTLQADALEQAPPCVDLDSAHLTDLSHHGNAR